MTRRDKIPSMWGATLILLSLSGAPQTAPDPAAPHPATRTPYRAPSVMPYQPPSAFELEALAEGDRVGGRAAAKGAVDVDAIERDYEAAVATRERQADAARGVLDGLWIASDRAGRELFALLLTSRDGVIEGGWRHGPGAGAAVVEDGNLTLAGLGVLALEAGEGQVRHGRLGRRAITLTRMP